MWKDHRKRDYLLYQVGIPHIYNAQEAQIVGNVGPSIPQIYAAFDKNHVDHQTYIIEMEGKLYD